MYVLLLVKIKKHVKITKQDLQEKRWLFVSIADIISFTADLVGQQPTTSDNRALILRTFLSSQCANSLSQLQISMYKMAS